MFKFLKKLFSKKRKTVKSKRVDKKGKKKKC